MTNWIASLDSECAERQAQARAGYNKLLRDAAEAGNLSAAAREKLVDLAGQLGRTADDLSADAAAVVRHFEAGQTRPEAALNTAALAALALEQKALDAEWEDFRGEVRERSQTILDKQTALESRRVFLDGQLELVAALEKQHPDLFPRPA